MKRLFDQPLSKSPVGKLILQQFGWQDQGGLFFGLSFRSGSGGLTILAIDVMYF